MINLSRRGFLAGLGGAAAVGLFIPTAPAIVRLENIMPVKKVLVETATGWSIDFEDTTLAADFDSAGQQEGLHLWRAMGGSRRLVRKNRKLKVDDLAQLAKGGVIRDGDFDRARLRHNGELVKMSAFYREPRIDGGSDYRLVHPYIVFPDDANRHESFREPEFTLKFYD